MNNDQGNWSGRTKRCQLRLSVVWVVFLCCFFSGFTGLIYEVVWLRYLVRVFGVTTPATASILSIFMGGLALGAAIAGRKVGQIRDLLKVYALLELCLGLYALAVPLILGQPLVTFWTGWVVSVDWCSRFVFALLVLIFPTVLMGATLPLLSQFVSHRSNSPFQGASYLYGLNTLGAFSGTVLTGFYLVPNFGLAASSGVAVFINLIIAGVVFLVLRVKPPSLRTGCLQGMRQGFKPLPHLPLKNPGVNAGVSSQAINFSDKDIASGSTAQGSTCFNRDTVTNLTERLPLPAVALVILAVVSSGMLSMMVEVTCTRFMCLILGSTTYAFSFVVSLVLLGVAAGSCLAAWLIGRTKLPLLVLGCLFAGASCYMYFSLLLVNELPWLSIQLNQAIAYIAGGFSFYTAQAASLLIVGLVVFVPASLLGAVLPMSWPLVGSWSVPVGKRVGKLYALNTLGAIAGAWLAGFYLIPKFSQLFFSGIQGTLILIAFFELVLALVLFATWIFYSVWAPRLRVVASLGLSVLVLLAVSVILHQPLEWNTAILSSGASLSGAMTLKNVSKDKLLHAVGARQSLDKGEHAEILFYQEGLNTTVTVGINLWKNIIYLANDGKVEACLPLDPLKPAPTSDIVTQVLLGDLALLVHPHNVKNVLVIGYGTGTTAGAILGCREVGQVTVAELENAVVAVDRYFNHINNRPLRDEWLKNGRVRLFVGDGRNYLSHSREKFDLIVSQPADPWVNGASDLFSLEFWQLGRSKLNNNGLFCQWIQLYSITPEYLGILCRTFHKVFPYVLVSHPNRAGELILVGSAKPWSVDVGKVLIRFKEPGIKNDLMRAGLHCPEEVLATIIACPPDFQAFCERVSGKPYDTRLNTDDNLLTEYQLPKQLFSTPAMIPDNLIKPRH